MTTTTRTLCLLLASSLLPLTAAPDSAKEDAKPTAPKSDPNLSLKLEIERAIAKGVTFLEKSQSKTGTWSIPSQPALTALPVRAILGDPNRKDKKVLPASAKRGLESLLSKRRDDGGIYEQGLLNYNTSISLMALLAADDPAYDEAILAARKFIIGQQQDYDKKGESDNALDGGIGYGNSLPHSDLSNTHLALEALYYAKRKFPDSDKGDEVALDWGAAIDFVSRCQNLPESNDQPWASNKVEDRGGFVYGPNQSKAGESTGPGGQQGLRSYGSMSYAGLLSLIYAELSPDDPRVVAVKEWLSAHYTLKENPNMGPQGLFYYYHTMAKALAATGMTTLKTPKGPVDWRTQLATHLFDLQQSDGSWVNKQSKRWMEDDPALVTAYALLSLEHIYYTL